MYHEYLGTLVSIIIQLLSLVLVFNSRITVSSLLNVTTWVQFMYERLVVRIVLLPQKRHTYQLGLCVPLNMHCSDASLSLFFEPDLTLCMYSNVEKYEVIRYL